LIAALQKKAGKREILYVDQYAFRAAVLRWRAAKAL
jgi:hypothetical protein